MPHPPHPPPPPLLPVSHLPSASTFYASLLQPLGIIYLQSTPNPAAYAAPPCLHYGYLTPSPAGPRPLTVFSLTQAIPHQPIRISHIVLPAQTVKQVREVFKQAEFLLPGRGNILERIDDEGGEHSVTRDIDGHIIEALYTPPPYSPKPKQPRSPTHTRSDLPTPTLDLPPGPPAGMSPDKDARRVLEWQSEVARSVSPADLIPAVTDLPIRGHVARSEVSYREREFDEPVTSGLGAGPGTFRRADTFPMERERSNQERPRERLPRREPIVTEHYSRPEEVERRPRGEEMERRPRIEEMDRRPRGEEMERRASGGVGGKAVIGTLIGAAVGVGLAYAMVRGESPEVEPVVERRRDSGKSFGNGRVYKEGSHYTHIEPSRGIQMIDHDRVEVVPARSYVSERSGDDQRGDRDIQPRYVTYTVSMPPQAPSARAHTKYSEAERIEHRTTPTRRGSDSGSRYERPLTIKQASPPTSRARSPSRHGPSRVRSPSRSRPTRRSGSGSGSEGRSRDRSESASREPSYASARSHQAQSVISQDESTTSGSTLKAEQELLAKVPTPPSAVSERTYHSGTVRDSGRSRASHHTSAPKPHSKLYRESEPRNYRDNDAGIYRERERRSTVSEKVARDIPLPRSTVGYEYAASVAPSDSVSSVGSKRERERLRERMRERTGIMGGGW